jgi:hypothetical protein
VFQPSQRLLHLLDPEIHSRYAVLAAVENRRANRFGVPFHGQNTGSRATQVKGKGSDPAIQLEHAIRVGGAPPGDLREKKIRQSAVRLEETVGWNSKPIGPQPPEHVTSTGKHASSASSGPANSSGLCLPDHPPQRALALGPGTGEAEEFLPRGSASVQNRHGKLPGVALDDLDLEGLHAWRKLHEVVPHVLIGGLEGILGKKAILDFHDGTGGGATVQPEGRLFSALKGVSHPASILKRMG